MEICVILFQFIENRQTDATLYEDKDFEFSSYVYETQQKNIVTHIDLHSRLPQVNTYT